MLVRLFCFFKLHVGRRKVGFGGVLPYIYIYIYNAYAAHVRSVLNIPDTEEFSDALTCHATKSWHCDLCGKVYSDRRMHNECFKCTFFCVRHVIIKAIACVNCMTCCAIPRLITTSYPLVSQSMSYKIFLSLYLKMPKG